MRDSSSTGSSSHTTGTERPVDEVRSGRVKVVVWRNQTRNGEMLNFRPVRIYKDGDDWKETPSLGIADLLPMAEALRESFRRANATEQ